MPSLRSGFELPVSVALRVERRSGPRDEVDAASRWLIEIHSAGTPWRDMAFVVPGKRKWRDPLVATFDALRIPHRLLVGHPGAKPDFDDDVVHAMSLFTAAEVSRPVVAIVGVGDLPWKQQSIDDATAVTMATLRGAGRHAWLSWSRASAATERLIDADAASPVDARTPG